MYISTLAVIFLLINQAQPIHHGTDEGEREAPYNVLDEESDIESHAIEAGWSEAPPVSVGEPPGEYDSMPPSLGEEYNDPEEPLAGEEYEIPPEYRMLEELKVLSESYGENGPRMLAEWINKWRQMSILDDPAKTEQWFEKVKFNYGPRLVGHKQCHRKNTLYLADTKRSTQHGKMPYDEWNCGKNCIK